MNNIPNPQSLLAQIAQITHMERGKLCVLRHGPNGPYYNCQSREQGKNFSRYVPPHQIQAYQEAIAGFQRYQELVEQYAQSVIERTRAELSHGSKKKKFRRNSSWPRNRKSGS